MARLSVPLLLVVRKPGNFLRSRHFTFTTEGSSTRSDNHKTGLMSDTHRYRCTSSLHDAASALNRAEHGQNRQTNSALVPHGFSVLFVVIDVEPCRGRRKNHRSNLQQSIHQSFEPSGPTHSSSPQGLPSCRTVDLSLLKLGCEACSVGRQHDPLSFHLDGPFSVSPESIGPHDALLLTPV